jgi:hypothetical protein
VIAQESRQGKGEDRAPRKQPGAETRNEKRGAICLAPLVANAWAGSGFGVPAIDQRQRLLGRSALSSSRDGLFVVAFVSEESSSSRRPDHSRIYAVSKMEMTNRINS